MKYWKLLAMCLLPLSFVACSDDDEAQMNTGNATVEFQSADMQVKENATIVEVPIVVSGEHNGNIKVTAKMISSSENFQADKDVIVTTENFVLSAETSFVNLEAHLVGLADEGINPGRTITFEITSVEGASLGGNKTCTVELKENNPLEGTYVVRGFNPFNNAVGSFKCTLSMEEGVTDKAYIDLGYGGLLEILLEEVEPGTKYNVVIPKGQIIGNNSSYGPVYFVTFLVDFETGGMSYGDMDIPAVFDKGVLTLDVPLGYGFGVKVDAGFFEAYVSYPGDGGVEVPVTFTKQ